MEPARTPFRTRCRPLVGRGFVAPLVALAASLASGGTAQAAPIVLDGAVPEGGPDHFFVEFDVPAGTKEIAITRTSEPAANILDFGLNDPSGYRGWGGGTKEPTIVGELAASRAYVAGPITPGKWRVVVGKAKVVASPATYRIEIDLRTAPTLPPFTDRAPYAPAPARQSELRYYAGDFHTHSRESTDAEPTIQEMITLAKSRGLDFIEVSDHNTITQHDQFAAIQATEPAFLLVPGIEYTTYAGHANAIGATRWVDHKIGVPGVTITGAASEIHAQGALFAINHPVLDLGDLCIGCAWKHDLDASQIDAVEIATGGLTQGGFLFSEKAIAFWDALLDKGRKIPAIGGSDDHRAGKQGGQGVSSPIGDPTTFVRASELSVAGIVDGLRKGATVVKLQGPGDPMVELDVGTKKGAGTGGGGDVIGSVGDTLGVRSAVLRVKVTGASGQAIRLVKNGKAEEPIAVTSDPFVHEVIVDAPAQGEDRWRAEALVDDKPHTVTSHVWLKLDPNGAAASDVSGAGDDGGCDVTRAPRASGTATLAGLATALGLVALRAVRRRRASR